MFTSLGKGDMVAILPSQVKRDVRGKSVRFTDGSKPGAKFDPFSIAGRFNCGSPGHMMNACPNPLNLTRAADRRIDYYDKKGGLTNTVHMVLADLCSQLQDTGGDVVAAEEDNEEDSNKDIFLTLMEAQPSCISYTGVDSDEVVKHGHYWKDEDYVCGGEKHYDSSSDESEGAVVFSDAEEHNFDTLLIIVGKALDLFEGACIDTSTQRSVIGHGQARAYCNFMDIPVRQ